MGEVKETVKGQGLKGGLLRKGKVTGDNLVEMFDSLQEEVSRLTAVKDEDVLKEGPELQAENMAKAARLRAVHGLLATGKAILEDY